MKKVNKELVRKIEREGGIWDARKYRYVTDFDGNENQFIVRRTLLKNLDTTAILEPGAWETIGYFD